MKTRLHSSKLIFVCLLVVFIQSSTYSTAGNTQTSKSNIQRAKSKAKNECAKCPSTKHDGEICTDCPIPENIDPNSDKPIPMGFPCCGRNRHQRPLAESATRRVEPEYPEQAKQKGIQGSVVVEVIIDEEGKVLSARAVWGHDLLNDAAIEAAKGWRFKPTQLNGKPVKLVGTITFIFKDMEATKEPL